MALIRQDSTQECLLSTILMLTESQWTAAQSLCALQPEEAQRQHAEAAFCLFWLSILSKMTESVPTNSWRELQNLEHNCLLCSYDCMSFVSWIQSVPHTCSTSLRTASCRFKQDKKKHFAAFWLFNLQAMKTFWIWDAVVLLHQLLKLIQAGR